MKHNSGKCSRETVDVKVETQTTSTLTKAADSRLSKTAVAAQFLFSTADFTRNLYLQNY